MLTNKIIITNYGENSISIVDPLDNLRVETIDLKTIIGSDTGITRVIYEEENKLLLINCDDDNLYRIDMSNLMVLNQVSLGRCPVRLKVFKDVVYIVNIDSNSLTVVDKKDFSVQENIFVGEKPADLAIDGERGKVYITNLNSYNLSVLDHNSGFLDNIKLSYMPFRVKVEGGLIYVLGFANNNSLDQSILSAIDPVEGKPIWSRIISGIYFDFIKLLDKDIFYLVDSENSWLFRFDSRQNKLMKDIYIGGLTNFMNYDLKNLYLNDMVNDQVIIVDIGENKIKKRINVGVEPHDILLT